MLGLHFFQDLMIEFSKFIQNKVIIEVTKFTEKQVQVLKRTNTKMLLYKII